MLIIDNKLSQKVIDEIDHFEVDFTSTGRIRYDPVRGKNQTLSKWWVILDTCPGIPLYYKKILEHYGIEIILPSWGSHITAIAGHEPPNRFKDNWNLYNGEKVTFEYSPRYINTDGEFWWIPVRCAKLTEIRQSLGLKSNPKWAYHLTIGKIKK